MKEGVGYWRWEPSRLKRVSELLQKAVEEKVTPGLAVRIACWGEVLLEEAFGFLDAGQRYPATIDALYDLASLTKPLVTASLLMVLVEEGYLSLQDEVTSFLPEVDSSLLKGVTFKHLVTHTSGLPAFISLREKAKTPSEGWRVLFRVPLEAEPGTRYLYSDIGYLLLGAAIERVTGQPLDRAFQLKIATPLGLERSGFWALPGSLDQPIPTVNPDLKGRVAETYSHGEGIPLIGVVHDPNARFLGGVCGHAGLFSNVREVGKMVDHLLLGFKEGVHPLFSPLTVRQMVQNQLPPSLGGHSIGWFTYPNPLHLGSDLFGKGSFSHSGFTGTSVLGDVETGISVVLLTNAVVYNTGKHLRLRRLVHNVVAGAIRGGEGSSIDVTRNPWEGGAPC